MNVEFFNYKTQENQNIIMNLVGKNMYSKGSDDINDLKVNPNTKFEEILDRVSSNQTIENDKQKSSDNKVEDSIRKEKGESENKSELVLPNQPMFEEVIKVLSLIKKKIEIVDSGKVVKDIDKLVGEISIGKIDSSKLSSIIKSLKNLIRTTKFEDKEIIESLLGKLKELSLKKNDTSDFLYSVKGKEAMGESKDVAYSTEPYGNNRGKVHNKVSGLPDSGKNVSKFDAKKFESNDEGDKRISSRIKVFDFRNRIENPNKLDTNNYEEKLVNQQDSKILQNSAVKKPIVRQKENSEQTFQKFAKEDNLQNNKVELNQLNYTNIVFARRDEVSIKQMKTTSFLNYLKPDIVSQLNNFSGLMIVNLRNDVSEMKMTLFPPELGKVFVKFESTNDGRIVGNIVVSTKEAFTLFEEHLQVIKDNLQSQGFQFVDINLSMNNNGFGNSSEPEYISESAKISLGIKLAESKYNNSSSLNFKGFSDNSLVNLYA